MPTTVGAAMATQGDIPVWYNALGTATPAQTVTIKTQISGQLLQVAFTEGQMVKKGQFLAQVDPRPYQALLQQAEGQLARDQALLENARLDLKRYQTLLAQDSISRQQADTQGALVRQYEGVVKSDQAAVSTQKLNLTYAHITSPVSGRVGLRQVDQGNYVTAGDANGLVVVTQVDPMDVLFTLPQDALAKITARQRSGASLTADALDRTQSTTLAQGKLLTLDNQIDTTTGTVRAKARFSNANGALFPNQFVNIRLLADTLKGVVVVPTAAVLRGSQGLFVYVIGPGRAVSVRVVKTGPASGELTAITEGLEAGERVVTDGSDRLREGQRVILAGDCIPAGFGAGGFGGRRSGASGGLSGGAGAGAPAGAATSPAKPGFFSFLMGKPKPKADPMAALRCAPGQHPQGMGGRGRGGGMGGDGIGAPATSANPGAGHSQSTTTTTQSAVKSAPTGATTGTEAVSPQGAAPRAPASGDNRGSPGGGGGGAGRMQAMLEQLNLDPAQTAKVEAISAAGRPKMMAAFQSGDMDAARTARQDMMRQIDAVLRPDQRARLAALREQQGGGGGGGGGPQ